MDDDEEEEEEILLFLHDNEFSLSRNLRLHHIKRCVDSTQDEAKRRILNNKDISRSISNVVSDNNNNNNNNHKSNNVDHNQRLLRQHIAIIADGQHNGRGTSGRAWVGSPGNLYMTYCIPMNDIVMKKITLLPLGIGVVVAEALSRVLSCHQRDDDYDEDRSSSTSVVNVKWPNDVLIDKKKVAGVLIENASDSLNEYWLLVGIGVNINGHPQELPPETKASAPARLATSLKQHVHGQTKIIPTAFDFGVELSKEIEKLVRQSELGRRDSNENSITTTAGNGIIDRWKKFADTTDNYIIRETGENVRMIGIEDDGQLRVLGMDGKDRLLVSHYFV
jgi:biotin-(acetyl-CoA carboxylase) ligase